MKFIHISDLHFGKNLHGYSMVQQGDQPYWVEEFLKLVDRENPQAIVIAGDVYDRGVPPKDGVELLDSFLTSLAERNITVLMIAGNHDSGTRLSFGSELLKHRNIHIAGEIQKEVKTVTLTDEQGPITFWLVPYLFPEAVKSAFGDESISGYDKAMRYLLAQQNIDFTQRNVIISHQTVLDNGKGPVTDGSETAIGGVGDIDVSAYAGFDYVALGHIHAAQKIGAKNVRYSGSPLCYHFSEQSKAKKGPVIVELGKKGEFSYRIEELPVLHPLREIKKHYDEIMREETANTNTGEYLRIVLTDDRVPTNSRNNLLELIEKKKSWLMEIAHEPEHRVIATQDVYQGEQKSVSELFVDFYCSRKKDEFPSEKDQELIDFIAEQIMSDDYEVSKQEIEDSEIDKLLKFVMKQEGK